jgi:hypothetical protein
MLKTPYQFSSFVFPPPPAPQRELWILPTFATGGVQRIGNAIMVHVCL